MAGARLRQRLPKRPQPRLIEEACLSHGDKVGTALSLRVLSKGLLGCTGSPVAEAYLLHYLHKL